MDQAIRNKLRGVVTQCRRLLEESVSHELEGKFGIFARKDRVTADPDAPMSHLGEEERAARRDILDHFEHVQARGFKPKEALDQLVREVAFTHLNRLCAYKMMEARQVYLGDQKFREAVSRGVNSNGVKFYLADHPEDERLFNSGKQDVAYRHFLDWLGGLLSEEIGVLFSPHDPANRLYPPQTVLDKVLDLLNDEALADIWAQDETIGWVYQYFTPKELRDQARKESQAPRNSYELAFRNQFFTPRYVVEFLTDNTLGRIWYEMRKGDTKLKDQCRYMVRRPSEVFLKDGEQLPKDAETKDDLPQEELLKLPVYIPYRPKKDPRELKILDPACGSGHFLLYCFDLLLTIYEEAYADPDLGPALQRDYPTLDALRRDMPRLILAHNLYGIDIDLRASQIAALALWLRCQRAYQDLGLKKDRPKITRSNFVCAEPMPGEEHMLKEFVGQIQPKLLGQLVEVVFDKMKLAGEAGSLLKIEVDIRDAVAEARKQWLAGPVSIQRSLFDDDKSVVKQQRFDFAGVTDAQFFEQAETKVVDALRDYAEKAQNGQRLQRRLFTEDTVRGFAFVDLCHKRFDVVLMNPPFGACTASAKGYIESRYENGRFDLGACFIDAMNGQTCHGGRVGVIANRTIWFLHRCGPFRHALLSHTMVHYGVDLGLGVLDALVETGLLVFAPSERAYAPTLWFRLNDLESPDATLASCVKDPVANRDRVFQSFQDVMRSFDGACFTYWLPADLQRVMTAARTLSENGGEPKQGLQTKDDERFLRLRWEVPLEMVDRRWYSYSKGGPFAPIAGDIHLVIDWSSEALACYSDRDGQFCCLITGRSNDYAFRPGITYSERTSRFSARLLPAGCLFGAAGPAVFVDDTRSSHDDCSYLISLVAILNTPLAQYIFDASAGASDEGKGRHYTQGMLGRFPIGDRRFTLTKALMSRVENLYRRLMGMYASSPTNACYLRPVLGDTLLSSYSNYVGETEEIRKDLELCLTESENEYADHLRLSSESLALVRLEVADQHRDACHEVLAHCEVSEHISVIIDCWFGYAVGRHDVRKCELTGTTPLEGGVLEGYPQVAPATLYRSGDLEYPLVISEFGILVDDSENSDDVVRCVQGVLEVLWSGRSDDIERECCEILNVEKLRDYFRSPGTGGFWNSHVKRYSKSRRKAPIYWLLQSSKKNYAIWLYYHRLDKDMLFKALVKYVEPKIRLEESRLETLRTQKAAAGESGRDAKRLGKEVEKQEEFLSELRDFEDKLRRAANLHLVPDLNDGVVLNIAPLWELVPWKEAKNYWEELLEGKYEWSSIGKQLKEKGLVK